MGFKDLRQLNLAMLAKQGWRMMQDQESLMFQCFKAWYFPRCHFLETIDSPTSSFTWKGIMAAKLVLQRESCWRVGNEAAIQILKDVWIPNHPTDRVLHSSQNIDEEMLVSELIDPESKWGDSAS